MSPLANSPPSSTPEPEMGSLPQDAAIVPKSATSQVLTGTNTRYQHCIGCISLFFLPVPGLFCFFGLSGLEHTLPLPALFSHTIKNQHVFRCRTLRTGVCLYEEALLPPFLIPFHLFSVEKIDLFKCASLISLTPSLLCPAPKKANI